MGVQRQYTGTAGRIENSQIAVYLVYAGARGHAAVDRELYVPRSWTCEPDRCRAAGLPESTAFATKPELAGRMIGRFLDAGHHVGWVAGDEVYGGNPRLRALLEERGVSYVLAVACSAEVTTGAGKFRADALAAKVPKRAWQKLSAGGGAKGHRFYDWAVIDLADSRPDHQQLLIRRNRTTGERAYYRCFSTAPEPLAVKSAGRVLPFRRRMTRPHRPRHRAGSSLSVRCRHGRLEAGEDPAQVVEGEGGARQRHVPRCVRGGVATGGETQPPLGRCIQDGVGPVRHIGELE